MTRRPPASYIFPAMYLPLICGFIAIVLVSVLMGWIMDASRHGRRSDRDRR
jgi:hypothetical protein